MTRMLISVIFVHLLAGCSAMTEKEEKEIEHVGEEVLEEVIKADLEEVMGIHHETSEKPL